jgi:KDO2-lipid IV(A) lauroyltransferase
MIGILIYYLSRRLKRTIRKNLSIAFGDSRPKDEVERLVKRIIIMQIKNAGVVVREANVLKPGDYNQPTVTGAEHAENAFRKGQGVIFLTAHIGPFESIAQELSIRGYRPYIVGTRMKDPKLDKLLTDNRTKFGAVAIERGKETYRIIKNIMSGGTAAMLIDQDTNVKSVFVDFFGVPCSTPIGPSLIALRTGAAIVPVFTHLDKNQDQQINFYPEVEVEKSGDEAKDILVLTQTLTSIIESEIRKFPDQWVWMHRRWKTRSMN